MVSTYHIMKIFKKATHDRFMMNLEEDPEFPSTVTVEQHTSDSRCRICLKKGTIPICNEEIDLSVDICTFGDIVISRDDEYPKFICDSCLKLLDSAILFRKTAKDSDQILRRTSTKIRKCSNKSREPENDGSESYKPENPSATLLQNFFSSVESENDLLCNDTNALSRRKKVTKVQCRICFKIITKAYYKEHFALHDHSEARYVCDICGKSFRQRCSYRTHYFTHSFEFPYKCNLCPYRGRHSGLLKTHMRTHTGDYRYMCTECPARFLTKSNLNKHALKHREPTYKCDTCLKGFHSKLVLERHFEADHLGIKNHICNVCGKAFGYRKAMMRHQLDVHKREKKMNGRTPAYLEAEVKKLEDSL
ncbi:zinc finger protein 160-like [Helicoverpa zea]|uniref:zinc finger protein 160-like n=1 Tax=Helicoverpa zea TaxID=7113 RepID=UPI001F58A573|nr:zinc finger protein 160-like [Helicoverpa zea]